MMTDRRRLLMAAYAMGAPPLPYDARLLYIETTGTQYIDTGRKPYSGSFGYKYGLTFYNDLSGTRTIAGQYNRWNNGYILLGITGNYNNNYLGFANNWRANYAQIGPLGTLGEYAEVSLVNNNDWNGSSFSLDLSSPLRTETVTFSSPLFQTASYNFLLSAINGQNYNAQERSHVRWAYFQMLEYSTVVQDLIPVRIGQTGYMYDRKSGLFLGNSGSGDFQLGPDIDPTPVTLGTLRYWWDGQDSLVGGAWVDRQAGIGLNATNSPAQTDGGWTCGKNVGYFYTTPNEAGIDLGRHWTIEVDCEIVSTGTNPLYVLDFGSLTAATHAFGLSFTTTYMDSLYDNYKGFSNATTYATIFGQLQKFTVGSRMTLRVGCMPYDSTQDVQYIEYNGMRTMGAAHTPTTFNHDFNRDTLYLGRGYDAIYCDGAVKIYSIKIYNND